MRILVLGGTVFLGRHVAAAALARGHELTLFTRGVHGTDLFPEATRLVGDRAGDLSALAEGEWDAVIDTSGYEPDHVGRLCELLADRIGHYVFVSSCNAYPDWPEEPSTRTRRPGRPTTTSTGRRRRPASGRPRPRCRAGSRPCAPD